MAKISIICGSFRKDSYNRKLSEIVKVIINNEYSEKIEEVKILDIHLFPFFSEDLEKDVPENILEFKKEIDESSGVIFITPEYNRSIPGVLKNAIDWASRPVGKNSFSNKKIICMGVSGGRLGTVSAQNELKKILVYLNTYVIGQPEIYVGEYKIEDEKVLELVAKGVRTLIEKI